MVVATFHGFLWTLFEVVTQEVQAFLSGCYFSYCSALRIFILPWNKPSFKGLN